MHVDTLIEVKTEVDLPGNYECCEDDGTDNTEKQARMETVEAKCTNNDRPEARDSSIHHVNTKGHEQQEISLRVSQSVDHLISLEVAILLFIVREEASFCGIFRK